MIPTLIAISVIVFVIIQLPPGDYLESHIATMQAQGESVDQKKIAFLREQSRSAHVETVPHLGNGIRSGRSWLFL